MLCRQRNFDIAQLWRAEDNPPARVAPVSPQFNTSIDCVRSPVLMFVRSAKALVALCVFLGLGLFALKALLLGDAVPGNVLASAVLSGDTASQVAVVQNLLEVDEFQALIREVILEELKHEYKSQHNWGRQVEAKQVKLRGKWFEPRLDKTEAEVNDGLWQRFTVTLVEPATNLQTRLEQVTATPDGRAAFVFFAQARVTGNGQFERWKKGVKLFDVSTVADATVAARIECELGIRREPAALVDDVVLDPRVTAIHLQVVDLDMRRVGKLGHDIARELGDALRPTIAHELEKREPHIVERANASLDKHRDRLRFSLERFLASGWSRFQSALAGGARTVR
jgi:hypothetical protein